MADPVRILLLADTHLGFDLPARPRVDRRRRGHDFQACYEAALAPARAGEVDLVVHGGDVFHRPGVSPGLAYQGLRPLVRVAEGGVPVVVVPGNHERARIPHAHLARHPRIHLLDRPRVVELTVRGVPVALAGFPYARRVRSRFRELLGRTEWRPGRGTIDLLCLHQCVEGATVGPSDFTFTDGADVIPGRDLPGGVSAVLSGHIHRHQVLTRDLRGEPLPAPVLYPGSVERTSLAERGEAKGYVVVEIDPAGGDPRWRFHRLPARPMIVRDLRVDGMGEAELDAALRALVRASPPEAILRVRTRGTPATAGARRVLGASHARAMAPSTMNLEIRDADAPFDRRRRAPAPSAQPTLGL